MPSNLCLATFTFLAASCLHAQIPSPVPTFEVSTVKPSSPDANSSDLNLMNGGMDFFSTRNVAMDQVVKFAYNLNGGSDDQILGAPAWLNTARFDIKTKVDDATAAQLSKMSDSDKVSAVRLMVQSLLADRFHFKIHHETRPLSVIALTLAHSNAKTDPQLTPSSNPPKPNEWQGLHNNGTGHVEVRGEPLGEFAEFLGNLPEIGGRLVLDQTHLTGDYDFTLTYTPQQLAGAPENGSTDPAGPTLFAALTEQLGLKLKSTKAPIDVIVIDHIDPPTPN